MLSRHCQNYSVSRRPGHYVSDAKIFVRHYQRPIPSKLISKLSAKAHQELAERTAKTTNTVKLTMPVKPPLKNKKKQLINIIKTRTQ